MNILIFSQYFYPETFIINNISEELQNKSNIYVVTSHPSYNIVTKPNYFYSKIMIYTINNKIEIPFLLFLLNYDDINDQYSFINTENYNTNKNIDNIINSILKKINVKYSGFLIYKNINYLFFEYDSSLFEYNEDNHIWGLISEIVNYKKIYNINIDNKLTDLFLNNEQLLNLTNSNKTNIYEHPYVGYSTTKYKKQDTIDDDNTIYMIYDYNALNNDMNNINKKNDIPIYRYAYFLDITDIEYTKKNYPILLSES